MFTGLIEEIGEIVSLRPQRGGLELAIAAPIITADDLKPGDSVAVAGACLTVEKLEAGRFWARVTPQTARLTVLGKIRVGQKVNLERALKVGDRLGGHFVLGHVDGIAQVSQVQAQGDSRLLEVTIPPHLAPYIVPQGSVCLAGVSLTVAELAAPRLTVSLVKETLGRTTLGEARPGDKLNFEVDILAKHISALMKKGVDSRLWTLDPGLKPED
jgi:riboflavin synthase